MVIFQKANRSFVYQRVNKCAHRSYRRNQCGMMEVVLIFGQQNHRGSIAYLNLWPTYEISYGGNKLG